MTRKPRKVGQMSPEEAQAFAAGDVEALRDHAPDAEVLAAQASEIRALHRSLTLAPGRP